MDNRFFEKSVLNSPYAYPARHWELDAATWSSKSRATAVADYFVGANKMVPFGACASRPICLDPR